MDIYIDKLIRLIPIFKTFYKYSNRKDSVPLVMLKIDTRGEIFFLNLGNGVNKGALDETKQ